MGTGAYITRDNIVYTVELKFSKMRVNINSFLCLKYNAHVAYGGGGGKDR
jgi:hypothetical protein